MLFLEKLLYAIYRKKSDDDFLQVIVFRGRISDLLPAEAEVAEPVEKEVGRDEEP